MANGQAVVARIQDGLDANRDGHIKSFANADSGEGWGRNAHNFKGIAIQAEAFADNRWISAEIALPEGVAEIGRAQRAARSIVRGTEKAADKRLDAENLKE